MVIDCLMINSCIDGWFNGWCKIVGAVMGGPPGFQTVSINGAVLGITPGL